MKLFKNVHRKRGSVLGCQDKANFEVRPERFRDDAEKFVKYWQAMT